MLEVRGLTKNFGALRATDNIDFDVAEGETHAVIGPAVPVPSSSSPATFRYDRGKDQYVYNADLRGFGVGTCHRFRIALDDGPHTALPTSPATTGPPPPTVIFSGVIKLKK